MGASHDASIDETSFCHDGWRIVAVCFLVASFGRGFGFYGQSVYLAELRRDQGWRASLISGATTFFYPFGAVIVVFVAEAGWGLGARNCLLGGIVALAAGAVAIGYVAALWQLYAANALLAFGWPGTSLAIITNTLSLWSDSRRGMAISLALNGANFGGVSGVPLLVGAIGRFGFARAMSISALAMLVILVPVVLSFVGRPPHHPPAATAQETIDAPSPVEIRAQALRALGFLSIAVAFALVLFAQVGFIVHSISFLDPIIGREKATVAVAVLTATAMAGRLVFSTVIDRPISGRLPRCRS